MVVGLQLCLGWLLCLANISTETTEILAWFLAKWFFNPGESRISGMQKVASMPSSLAVACTLTLLKDVRRGAVPAFGWISRLPCINNAEGMCTLQHHHYGSLRCLLHWLLRNHGDECSTNAEKGCPQVSHSLAACEWAPDFSAPRLIEIMPFSQNNSVTSLLFKQALPSVSAGLTMWQWLGCYNVQHRMKACWPPSFYPHTSTSICAKLFPHCPSKRWRQQHLTLDPTALIQDVRALLCNDHHKQRIPR